MSSWRITDCITGKNTKATMLSEAHGAYVIFFRLLGLLYTWRENLALIVIFIGAKYASEKRGKCTRHCVFYEVVFMIRFFAIPII